MDIQIHKAIKSFAKRQLNLDSSAARKLLTDTIIKSIKTKCWYLNLNTYNGKLKDE
jgi:hypothetical protein|tara:strand:- start:476 stop:643 length:168 start_codon:yes stop_codon:yes gene_type:complete